MNICTFSHDRYHRFTLLHVMRPGGKRIAWIGLNPSTADEQKLDPTLTRIRAFSLAAGYDEFVMLNLFSYRATDPKHLPKIWDASELLENGYQRRKAAEGCAALVFAWGATHHQWQMIQMEVAECIRNFPSALCLGTTKHGHPRHPLYVHGKTKLEAFAGGKSA